jgi:hypothetical protein
MTEHGGAPVNRGRDGGASRVLDFAPRLGGTLSLVALLLSALDYPYRLAFFRVFGVTPSAVGLGEVQLLDPPAIGLFWIFVTILAIAIIHRAIGWLLYPWGKHLLTVRSSLFKVAGTG